jgi:type IV pilus assembly protein PilW
MKYMQSAIRKQAGFSLVELMVAILIGLFFSIGMVASFAGVKRTFVSQDGLAQLQDNERLVLSVLNSTVQSAGYYPNPTSNTAATALPARTSATFGDMAAGQGVVGSGDTLTARFASVAGDGLMDCLGQTTTASGVQVVTNIFRVTGNELTCSVDNGVTFVPLVSNVQSMAITYLVDTDPSDTVDAFAYRSAADVSTGALWPSVKAAVITVNLANPLSGQPGQPARITWVQNINLMNKK